MLKPSELRALADPVIFGQTMLGMKYYPKQAAALRAMVPAGARVAFKSCNEGGKTSRVITTLILWHLFCFPKGTIKSTSGSWSQIETQLTPKLRQYENRFPSWRFQSNEILTPEPTGFWRGISTNEPGRFEGAHADDDSPLLIIVDEAKTVQDPIFEAVERCRPTRSLITSSTGISDFEFYRAFTTRARYYTALISQTVAECPHIPAEYVAQVTEKWGGRDSDLIKSMFWAEFMTQADDGVINLAALDALLASPPAYIPLPEQKGFCDFAAGGDENVFAVRKGNRITIQDAWREKNTMSAVGRFITNFKAAGLKADEIDGDADGMGIPICDALADAGWPISRFHGGSAPRFEDRYLNLITETWMEGNSDIEKGRWILPNDPELRGQLMARRKRHTAQGKLALETKEAMRARGVPSPDRADAVLGVMRPPLRAKPVSLVPPERWDYDEPEMGQRARPGFDAGG